MNVIGQSSGPLDHLLVGAMVKLSNFDLKRRISALARMDPRKVSYEMLSASYSAILTGVQAVVGASNAELYFRARRNPRTKPAHLRELGPPPAEIIADYQRCNQPGQPMFYTASRRITALRESRIARGDMVYLSQWIGKEGVAVNKSLYETEEMPSGHEWSSRSQAVYAHIEALFTRRIHEDFSEDYKFTSAATSAMMQKFPHGEHGIKEDGLVGLRYPSVLDIENSYNTVFHSAHLGAFELLHVTELEIINVGDIKIDAAIRDTAVKFPGGLIAWTGEKGRMPTLRPAERHVVFRYKEDSAEILTVDRDMSPDELNTLLNE